jgi:hypothetical protein
MIVIEIACGTPPAPRERTMRDIKHLQLSVVATTAETLALIERERYYDSGCGAVDMALLAAVLLTPEAELWTLDRKLRALAEDLGIAFSEAGF